ncbi:unnamed protein product [Closterium sp. NIES-53]
MRSALTGATTSSARSFIASRYTKQDTSQSSIHSVAREQRLEHRTKHIALRYFLARELQQRGQLRLAYVASEANTADVFTKAVAPCDHQRCCTQLGLLCCALLDWSCDPLFSPTLPMGCDSGNCSMSSQLCVLAVAL